MFKTYVNNGFSHSFMASWSNLHFGWAGIVFNDGFFRIRTSDFCNHQLEHVRNNTLISSLAQLFIDSSANRSYINSDTEIYQNIYPNL